MDEGTVIQPICKLCGEPITDHTYEAYYDQDQKEIVYRHTRGYCTDNARKGPYMYMKRLGETKWD